MSDEKNKHRVPFALLNDMKELFIQKYGHEVPQRASESLPMEEATKRHLVQTS